MIDLHSHILPGIDDGSAALEMSIAMARMAADDGIVGMACTPHVVPGLYDNTADSIRRGVDALREEIDRRNIALKLTYGADVHVAPDLPQTLRRTVPTLGGTRYFLFEPTHHVMPPRIVDLARSILASGFVPILTHPERLSWIENHYAVIVELNNAGCLLQVTAGSLTGDFGRTCQHYADRLLDEGRVDILASDAHNTKSRPPRMSAARELVARRYGDKEAREMVMGRPLMILADKELPPRAGRQAMQRLEQPEVQSGGLLNRFLKLGGRE